MDFSSPTMTDPNSCAPTSPSENIHMSLRSCVLILHLHINTPLCWFLHLDTTA